MKHLQMIISGKVENTGFRFYALRGASLFGVCGSVMIKNGHAIVEAEGEEEKLREYGEWCRKGPDDSSIDSLICNEKEVIGYEDFKIL